METIKTKSGTKLIDRPNGKAKIKEVEHQEYLGDLISSDCSHAKTIQARIGKRHGVVKTFYPF